MVAARVIALIHFIFLFYFGYSQDCSTARLAAYDVLETVQIYSNEYALDSDHVSYEIASSPPSNSFDQVSDSVRIMVNNQSACPSACTVTLNRYTDSFQGAETTVLFFDTEHSFYLPSHYIKDNITTFVCVATNGSCGATVPIYRYYKISNGGVFHAYSLDQDVIYDGYNQEFLPICYAWSVSTATVASRPTCGTLSFDIPPETLSDLNIYDNNLDGIERDHYYTTLHSTDPNVSGYNQTGVLGKILTSSKSTACSCLVKLQQQFDNQTGYFHRLDHKLIVTGQEQNRPYEEYVDTGETLYCSKRLGDCGATLPLWKHFQFYDVDTVYTTDSSPLPMSYLYPQTPLCYIWPANYSPNVSNINSGTIAPAPPIQTTQLPVILDSTLTTVSTIGTTATGSTKLSDEIGATSTSTVNLNGSPSTSTSTLSTNSVLNTQTPSTQSTFSTASSISTMSTIPSLGTTPTQSTQSTISVWNTPSTPNTMSTGTVPTGSTISTNQSTGTTPSVSSQSTISVWGTLVPSTPSTQSTASIGTATPVTSPTVSIWSTESTTTGTTGSTSVTTNNTTPTNGVTSATTIRLSDSGGATPGIIIPLNPSVTTATTPEYPVTIGGEITEAPLETENPEEFNPQTPETFTLSNFWFNTTTSSSVGSTGTTSSINVNQSPNTSVGTVPPPPMNSTITPSHLEMTTPSTNSGTTPLFVIPAASPVTDNSTGGVTPVNSGSSGTTQSFEFSTLTTAPPPVMVTGPLVFIIPTIAPTDPSSTIQTSSPSSMSTPLSSLPTATSTTTATHTSEPSTGVLTTNTPTPQHVAQAAPTYSIVGGALDSFTNPPIIAALISSSTGSTSAPLISQPTQLVLTEGSIPSSPLSQPTQPTPNVMPITATADTQDPGIIWKAGDWISNTWHSVFGGNDQTAVSTSSNQNSETSTTIRPIGGLVGSLINSPNGNNSNSSNHISSFWNSTGNFIDQHLNSNSTQNFMNNTVNWIDDKLDSTGEFLSNAWDSLKSNNSTSGSFVNNTQNWIDGAINSTGGFISNAWNSLGNSNSNSNGNVLNNTQTWIGGAVDSTGDFLSNAWNSLSSNNNTGTIVNNTQTWIGGAINSTGGFLTNAWNSLGSSNGTVPNAMNSTTTWVGGAVNSTGEFLSNAWNSLSSSPIIENTKNFVSGAVNSSEQFIGGVVEGTKNLTEGSSTPNVTVLASAPGSSLVGSVASVILPIVNSSTPEPIGKIEWNGGLVSGPITG